MPRPVGFIDLIARKVGDDAKTIHLDLSSGEFFDGGEITVSIKKLSAGQKAEMGLDSKTQRRQLYCEGKFFKDGHIYHFVLEDFGRNNWSLKQIEAGILDSSDSWERSSQSFAGFVPSEDIYQQLIKIFQTKTG